MFTQRARIQAIKADTEHSKELIALTQSIVDQEWQKPITPEVRVALEKLENTLGSHRQTVNENEALIAKLERPFWKFW